MPLPPTGRVADTDTYDGAGPVLTKVADGTLLLLYRQSDGEHHANDARLVGRTSTDNGVSWSDEQVVHEEAGRDVGGPSVVFDQRSGRIVVFDRAVTMPEEMDDRDRTESRDAYRLESTDDGETWSEPTNITDEVAIERPSPFGGYAVTSKGLLTQFYNASSQSLPTAGTVEATFSTDGGRTWGENVIVVDGEGSEHNYYEPTPCAVTERKIITFGRHHYKEVAGFYAVKSDDGGETWGDPVHFDITGGTYGAVPNTYAGEPIWVRKTGPNEITAAWTDRTDRMVYALSMSAHLAWQDPTYMADETPKRIYKRHPDSEAFGYVTFVDPDDEDELFATFYDDDRGTDTPNIWQTPFY